MSPASCEGCGAPPEPGLRCSYCLRFRIPAAAAPSRPGASLLAAGVIGPNELRAIRDAWERRYILPAGWRWQPLINEGETP